MPFCVLQWQYCPDNTGLAKRRRAKRAQASAAAAEPDSQAHTVMLHKANDFAAHMQTSEVPQCEVNHSLSGHLPAAEPGGASPATQPAALTLTELAHTLDHVGTCDRAEEVSPLPNPGALHLPARLQFSHDGDSPNRGRQLAMQEPTEPPSDLPKASSTAQEDTPTPDQPASPKLEPLISSSHPSSNAPPQGVQSSAEDVAKTIPSDSAGTFGEQAPRESACQATAAPTAAQTAAPPLETQAYLERAVHECSPEPRAATEGPQAVMGSEHIALHDVFGAYAKSRSRSQDGQQQQQRQPRQLSVPNPFRVSPEALQRPTLPSTHLHAAAQDSSQTPAQNCPARAPPRSVSPEALHVLQLGIADQQLPTVHSTRCNKSALHGKSPETQSLAAPMPCRETLQELAQAGWKPGPLACVRQVDSEQEDTLHSSTEEVCSDSERRAGHTWLSTSSGPAAEIIMMQNKLGKQHVQLADVHQCLEDVPSCDGSPASEAQLSKIEPHNVS